jgi:cobalt-zinc-cadmium efflux system protein
MHEHAHTHNHGAAGSQRVLSLALGLTLGYVLVEAVSSWWSGSLALLSTAAAIRAP